MFTTAFIVPLPTSEDWNDFLTRLPLPNAARRRLSTASSSNIMSSSNTSEELIRRKSSNGTFYLR
ncbi:hypothetical protein PT974_12079 [Cladobotryum mycophilum]|uniref:Uncharacterized protein n=1 Tax=Cladobotryum mycophilum TaxID=491253 RepID=A0ABR0S752_9HYPO